MADVLSDHFGRKRPPGGQQQQDEQPDVENGDADCQSDDSRCVVQRRAFTFASRRRPVPIICGQRMSHAIIAALAKIVAALNRQGPMLELGQLPNCRRLLVLYRNESRARVTN